MGYVMVVLSFFAVLVSASVNAEHHDRSRFDEERELLKSEIVLAAKPDIYFVFDSNEMKINIKAKGMVLTAFDIAEMRFWGKRISIKPHSLVRKSALFEPKRETIQPEKEEQKKNESGAPGIRALELDDMPGNYRLVFDEDITFYINTVSPGITGKISNVIGLTWWYIYRPLETVWYKIKEEEHTSIRLTMSAQDAQSLYWSIMENMNLIIYQPQSW